MGGEWATGAALVSESFPARHRGKALAFVQSAWAIGYGLAALVNLIVMPIWGWRGVFFVGVLPALFTLWIRRNLEEPRDVAVGRADRARPFQHALQAWDRGHDRRDCADEFLMPVCLVGIERVGARVLAPLPGSGWHRPVLVHDVVVRHRDAGRACGSAT